MTLKESIEFLDSDIPVEEKIKTIKSICLGFTSDIESYYKNSSEIQLFLSEIAENLKLLNQRVSNIEDSIM
ncbi:hypothetical protein BSU00_04030 [Tenacibaculum sp. SG-28]|nr:hypothetical protein BSU00_04030 [Tenacibaculum sp. SG-28]